jgi:hypothetical protein
MASNFFGSLQILAGLGFVFGAIGIGFMADLFGASAAINSIAWIALASGIYVLIIMGETKYSCQ